MDEPVESVKLQKEIRRISILKEAPSTDVQEMRTEEDENPLAILNTNRRSLKRVSFADTTSIKEFLATRDASTEWNCTYEKPVGHDSTSTVEATKAIHVSEMSISTSGNITPDFCNENGSADLLRSTAENPESTKVETSEISDFLMDFLGMKSSSSSKGIKKEDLIKGNVATTYESETLIKSKRCTTDVPLLQKSEYYQQQCEDDNRLKVASMDIANKTNLSQSEMDVTCGADKTSLIHEQKKSVSSNMTVDMDNKISCGTFIPVSSNSMRVDNKIELNLSNCNSEDCEDRTQRVVTDMDIATAPKQAIMCFLETIASREQTSKMSVYCGGAAGNMQTAAAGVKELPVENDVSVNEICLEDDYINLSCRVSSNNSSQIPIEYMEMTCKVPSQRSNQMPAEDMDMTCKTPSQRSNQMSAENMDMTCKTPSQKSNQMPAEDMDMTCKVPSQRSNQIPAEDMDMTCKTPSQRSNQMSAENMDMTCKTPSQKSNQMPAEDMDMTCKVPSQRSNQMSAENMDMTCKTPSQKSNQMPAEDMDMTCKVPSQRSNQIPAENMDMTCKTPSQKSNQMPAEDMDMACKVPSQRSNQMPAEDMDMTYKTPSQRSNQMSAENMDMTCKTPSQKSNQMPAEDMDMACKVPSQRSNQMPAEDMDMTYKTPSQRSNQMSAENMDMTCKTPSQKSNQMPAEDMDMTCKVPSQRSNQIPAEEMKIMHTLPLQQITSLPNSNIDITCVASQYQMNVLHSVNVQVCTNASASCHNGSAHLSKEVYDDLPNKNSSNEKAIQKSEINLGQILDQNPQFEQKRVDKQLDCNHDLQKSKASGTLDKLKSVYGSPETLRKKIESVPSSLDEVNSPLEDCIVDYGSIVRFPASSLPEQTERISDLSQPIDGLLTAPITNRKNLDISVSLVGEDLCYIANASSILDQPHTSRNGISLKKDISLSEKDNAHCSKVPDDTTCAPSDTSEINSNTERDEHYSSRYMAGSNTKAVTNRCSTYDEEITFSTVRHSNKRSNNYRYAEEPDAKIKASNTHERAGSASSPKVGKFEYDDVNLCTYQSNDQQHPLQNVAQIEKLHDKAQARQLDCSKSDEGNDELIEDIDVDLVNEESLNTSEQDNSNILKAECSRACVDVRLSDEAIIEDLIRKISHCPMPPVHTCTELSFLKAKESAFAIAANETTVKAGALYDDDDIELSVHVGENHNRKSEHVSSVTHVDTETNSETVKRSVSCSTTEANKEEVHDNYRSLPAAENKCRFCFTHFLRKSEIQISSKHAFDITENSDGWLMLKLRGRPFKLCFDISVHEYHLKVVRCVWSPQEQDLRKPYARLGLNVMGKFIAEAVQDLLTLSLCSVTDQLKKVVAAYESTMNLLREIYIVQATFMTAFTENSCSTIERAISQGQKEPRKVLSIVKMLASVIQQIS